MWVTGGGEPNQPVIQPGLRPCCVMHCGQRGSRGWAWWVAGGRVGGSVRGLVIFMSKDTCAVCFHTSGRGELFLGCDL